MPTEHGSRRLMSLLVSSVLMVLLAAAMFNLAGYIYPGDFSVSAMSTGFSVYWVGIPAIVTSILGIATVRMKHRKCVVIAHTASAIFSVITAFAACIMFGVFIASSGCYNSGRHCFSARNSYKVNMKFSYSVLAVQGVICCTAIISSVLSYKLLSSSSHPNPRMRNVSAPGFHDNMGMMAPPPYPHDNDTDIPQVDYNHTAGFTLHARMFTHAHHGVPDAAPPPYYPREEMTLADSGETPGDTNSEETLYSQTSSPGTSVNYGADLEEQPQTISASQEELMEASWNSNNHGTTASNISCGVTIETETSLDTWL